MNLGNILKRAVSAFASSKTRSRKTRTTRSSTTRGGSGQSDIVRGVTKMAKKKL